MRIGLVLSQVPGYSETFFRNKIKLLHGLGHQVFLFAENPDHIKVDGATVIDPPRLSRTVNVSVAFRFLKTLLISVFIIPGRSVRFLKIERCERISLSKAFGHLLANCHILRHDLDWLHFGFATMALQRENVGEAIAARVAVSFRGYDIAIYPVKNPGCYTLLWKKLHKVHTISDDLLEMARQQGLPHSIAVVKVTPAIDVNQFYNSDRTGRAGETIRLLSVGRLHWKKGYEYAFGALTLLKERGVDCELTIVGEGKELERLSFSVWQRGLSDKIRFAGKVPHGELPGLMRYFDVYIQPSVQEGFCNSVLEAQCNGLYCIVSDAEGLPENVVDGQTGRVVPKRSPEMLARAIEEYRSMDEETRLRIIHQAQNRVRKVFTLEQQMEKFNTFYNS